MKIVLSLTIAILSLSACSKSETRLYETGFNTTDTIQMELIQYQLELNSIPFRVESDGGVTVSGQYDSQLDAAKQWASSSMGDAKVLFIDDIRTSNYLISLLEEESILYSLVPSGSGSIVQWHSLDGNTPRDFSAELEQFEANLESIESSPSNN